MVALLALVLAVSFSGVHDTTPPLFAGVASATTCLAGPGGGDRASRYHLAWKPAHDNRTPQRRIVYDVYVATAPGAERYAHPRWTTPPGATSFVTPELSSSNTYWFVVRARDAAGNRDRNRHEVEGVNICV